MKRSHPVRETTVAENPGDSRERIMREAKRLFAQKGYGSTTVRDIAQATGLNVSLVSYHFGGKEGLYRECLEQAGTENLHLAQTLLAQPRKSEDFRAALTAYIGACLDLYFSDLDTYLLVNREIETMSPVFQELLQPVFIKTIQQVARFFKAAQEAGFVGPSYDPAMLANLLHGAMGHAVHTDKIRHEYFAQRLTRAEVRERLIRHIEALFERLDG